MVLSDCFFFRLSAAFEIRKKNSDKKLDRFGMNKIFVLLTKRSRLAIRNSDAKVRLSNGKKQNGRLSLDRFIKKSVIKNILFMPKRSRLALGHDVRLSNVPTIAWSGPVQNRHSKAGTVRLSVVYCTSNTVLA